MRFNIWVISNVVAALRALKILLNSRYLRSESSIILLVHSIWNYRLAIDLKLLLLKNLVSWLNFINKKIIVEKRISLKYSLINLLLLYTRVYLLHSLIKWFPAFKEKVMRMQVSVLIYLIILIIFFHFRIQFSIFLIQTIIRVHIFLIYLWLKFGKILIELLIKELTESLYD